MGSGEEYRGERRIEYHFIIRVKPVKPSGAAAGAVSDKVVWDVSTVRNISKTGVLFRSSKYYDYNADVEVRIKNPIVSEEIICFGRVARCELLGSIKNVYDVAVEITSMDPKNKEIYDKTVRLFIDRSERPK